MLLWKSVEGECYLGQYSSQCRRKWLAMDECHQLEYLHVQRASVSDKQTECLRQSAIKSFPGTHIRTYMPYGNIDWEKNLYFLRKQLCPAVLTENFFMDNHSDLEYLQSKAGKQAVVDIHIEGIIEYLEVKQCQCLELRHRRRNIRNPTATDHVLRGVRPMFFSHLTVAFLSPFRSCSHSQCYRFSY